MLIRVQVTKIGQWNQRFVHELNEDGSIIRRMNSTVVTFPKANLSDAEVGTIWDIKGERGSRTFAAKNGIDITQNRIKATSAKLVRPSGGLLEGWIAMNVDGIGEVKARRLVRAFPNDLLDRIHNKDVEALSSVSGMSVESAQALIDKMPSERLFDAIEWLQDSKLPASLAHRLIRVFDDPISKIQSNPLMLTAFGVSFSDTIKLIKRKKMKVSETLIQASIAEKVHIEINYSSGSTVSTEAEILEKCEEIIDQINESFGENNPLKISSEGIIQAALKHKALIEVDGGYQSLGTAIQERTVGRFFAKCMNRKAGKGSLLAAWERYASEAAIEKALISFESTLPFQMTSEQRSAVIQAVKSPVSVISGGAGTGKTTILLALLSIYDQIAPGLAQYQVALSGRAAQRMSEATNREAMTIAKFINDHIGEGKRTLEDHLLLIVDEASMVDLLSAYRMVGILPYSTRIILVGDVAQLPPVGAGLIFHAAMNSDLPVFELTQVKRQGQDSGIHKLATAIRNAESISDLLNSDSGDTKYISDASKDAVVEEFMGTFDVDPETIDSLSDINLDDLIVLTPTNKGPMGVKAINTLIQSQFDPSREELRFKNFIQETITWITPKGSRLKLGDRIMITANDYDANIRNGDLGTLVEVFTKINEGDYGTIEVNGQRIAITDSIIEKLELGYACTIHKSQGSQWKKCILLLPSYAEKMTDQSLIYTAVTRPTEELVLMGDSTLIESAIAKGNTASGRLTNIKFERT